LTDCKAYCSDPTNQDACIAYAKQKGFYHSEGTGVAATILAKAKTVLGCETEEACKAFCAEAENRDKCEAFAQANNLTKTKTNNSSADNKTLSRAKEFLGCTSVETCKAFCAEEQNHDKCTAFAKSVGLAGGTQRTGPGGCTSEDSCKTYCSTHTSECEQYSNRLKGGIHDASSSGAINSSAQAKLTQEKAAVCREHPEECKQIFTGHTSSGSSGFIPPPPVRTSSTTGENLSIPLPSGEHISPFLPPPPTTTSVKGASTEDTTTGILDFLIFGF